MKVLDWALERVHLLEHGVGLASEAGNKFACRFNDLHPAEGVHDHGVERRAADVRFQVIHLLERHQEKETLRDAGLAAQCVAGLIHRHGHRRERDFAYRAARRDEHGVGQIKFARALGEADLGVCLSVS